MSRLGELKLPSLPLDYRWVIKPSLVEKTVKVRLEKFEKRWHGGERWTYQNGQKVLEGWSDSTPSTPEDLRRRTVDVAEAIWEKYKNSIALDGCIKNISGEYEPRKT